MTTEDDVLLTLNQVCAMFSIGKKTLMKWRNEGRLTAIYPNGKPPPDWHGNLQVRISRNECLALMEKLKAGDGI